PIVPSLLPVLDSEGQPLPYIASNDITVFSIFDTAVGSISSYRFDTRDPDGDVVKFDEFFLI
ncbi:MAG: metallophosphoesterase, partial [Snowella sp.]